MPVCFNRKIIFVHIPKTGGQSIESLFGFKESKKNFFGWEKHAIDGQNKTIEYTHYSYEMLKKEIDIKSFFSFSFIRNPFDRLVSEYFFRPKNGPFFQRLKMKKFNFEDFVYALQDYKLSYSNDDFSFECHLMPQHKFLYDINLKSVDFLGRYENYNQDVNYLKKILNIESPIIHKNKTNHKNYKFYYNNETKKIVETLYKKDLETFNYTY